MIWPCFGLDESSIQIEQSKFRSRDEVAFVVKLMPEYKIIKKPKVWIDNEEKEISSNLSFDNVKNSYLLRCKLNPWVQHNLKFQFFVCGKLCHIINKSSVYHPPEDHTTYYFWLMIFFGFVGGMLLNIMPCVLPVIMLKIRHMTSSVAVWSSIFGNYISFIALAIVTCLLKQLGNSVGWGFHFQNIYFLKSALVFLFVFTLMSFNKINFFFNLEMKQMTRGEIMKNIISSVMITLLAIPCSAPFLGSAVTFAIQEAFPNLLLIFIAIATGFNIPYFLAIFIDVSFLKKLQGTIFQKIINFGVVSAFLWLTWQLSVRIKLVEFIAITLLFTISFLLFDKNRNKLAWLSLFGVMLMNISGGKGAQPFNPEEVEALINKNHVVVVNVTADWCVSCKYNKLKLMNSAIRSKLKECNAKFIEVDITEHNEDVIKYMKKYGRSGIPFTLVCGPGNRQGILLSEIPSEDEIMLSIDQAK